MVPEGKSSSSLAVNLFVYLEVSNLKSDVPNANLAREFDSAAKVRLGEAAPQCFIASARVALGPIPPSLRRPRRTSVANKPRLIRASVASAKLPAKCRPEIEGCHLIASHR